MANLSTADVDIYVEKVGKELLNYINVTNKTPTDYAILYEGFPESEIDKDGNLELHGSSSGRWAYSNNLEGYFDAERVKSWLGVGEDYKWLDDKAKKQEYKDQSEEQYAAYLALVEALKKTGGRIEINYTDCDPAMDWMSTGGAVLEVDNGEVSFMQSDESETLDVERYAELQDMTVIEALEMVHGEEPAEKYEKYLVQCKKEEKEPLGAQEWYDNEFEWED